MHTCPMLTVLVPHVGGPILPPGAPTVLIGFLPAATVTTMAVCVGPPDVIVKGSAGVFINFLPAARMGDLTAHGGVIILGCPTVIIGEIGAPSPGAGGMGGIVAGLITATSDPDSANPSKTSTPAKKGAGAAPAPAPSPCAGKGMDTPASQQEFAKDMKALQKDWKTLTVDQRRQRLADAANKQLGKSGAPKIGIADDTNPANSGSMNFRTWNLDMNPSYLSKPDMTDAETQDLADTTYHETRHVEQWYEVARKEAAEGKTPAQIHTDLDGMDAGACTSAKANPMTPADPMKACADKIHASVYGAGAVHREKVLKDLYASTAAYNTVNANYIRINNDPASTPAQKKAAYDQAIAAYNVNQARTKDYKELPEEADAWSTASGVSNLLKPKP